jgi:hypothetical protein
MQIGLFIIEDDLDQRQPASGPPRREPRKDGEQTKLQRLYVRPEPNVFSDDTRPAIALQRAGFASCSRIVPRPVKGREADLA